MSDSKLLQRISRKGSNKEKIAAEVARCPEAIAPMLDALNSEKPAVKFGCSKVLRLISEMAPETLYPQMDFFVRMLESGNTFLRLDAARVIANLTRVDHDARFERIFEKYFSPITGPTMIPAANAIGCGAAIALAKPALTGRIVGEILRVERASYATEECRNIALGHAIQSFDVFFHQIQDKAPVMRLIRKQLDNPRPSTRKKAALFMRKHAPAPVK